MIDVNLIGAPAFAVRIVGEDFVYAGLNARLAEITGLRAGDLVGRTPEACLPPQFAAQVTTRYRACAASRQPIEAELLLDGPSGARWWHTTVTPVLDAGGDVVMLIGVSTDITARRLAERDQRDLELRMALAMDVLDGGFWYLDSATGEVEASPKLALLMTGSTSERVSWREFASRLHPEDRDLLEPATLFDGSVDNATVEYRVRDPRGDERWLRCKARATRGSSGVVERVVGVVIDVTEPKRVETLYAREAMTDPLTSLSNRRGFDRGVGRFLEAASRLSTRFGLIVIDLDGFKPVNDSYGHATGDVVLRDLGARIAGLIRAQDVAARIGGDEFAVLVADVRPGDLQALAERLLAAIREPVATPAGDVRVGASLGLATSRIGERGADDLAARADEALYAAKTAGRGAWRMAA